MVPRSTIYHSSSSTNTSTEVDPVVTCTDVSRHFTRGSSHSGWFSRSSQSAEIVTALSNISLSVTRGEFVGLAGPSGSGKSTLLHLLAALDTPSTGSVTLAGRQTNTLSTRQRTKLRLDHVGIVFQHFHLLPSLSARANVATPLIELGYSRRQRRQRATELLANVGLDDRVHHTPGELSGGEQQRVAVARALATDPDLVIADEPTGELDTTTGKRVLDVLAAVATDRAVIVASHDPQVLDRVDRVIRLRDGHRQKVDETT
ncbi:ABC transporter ATP-binding protein [Halopenitus persicus]|uniref:Putative ABC transport system ATP-binding protein n=1 Tax=Halopenitus persicus TaxID=1048396 RepID=A0A1H3MEE5_9EURY|nr:ABC transporter ATP-binding protein [Halopenitus persicus]SDY75091.1 putative ABC transport system ATP-binding protein [Halopenitus persicus]